MNSIRIIRLISWLTFFGCQHTPSSQYQTEYDGPTNHCQNNSDCSIGTCNKKLSICAQTQTLEDRQLSVVFYPNQGAPQTFSLDFSDGDTAAIHTATAINVAPYVLKAVDSDAEELDGLDARIYILDKKVLPDSPSRIITSEVSEKIDDPPIISLYPGWSRYDVRVDPKDDDLPPKYFRDLTVIETNEDGVFVSSEGTGLQTLILEQADRTVVGEIHSGSQPLAGVRVQAIDSETNQPISTPFVTQCLDNDSESVCGEFQIQMRSSDMGSDPDNFDYTLKIQKEGDPAYPVTTIPASSGTDMGDGSLLFELPGMSNSLVFEAQVEGKVVLENGVRHDGLSGCRLIFESTEEEGAAQIKRQIHASTDYMGAVKSMDDFQGVLLYPSLYDIYILPPLVSLEMPVQYGILREESLIENQSTGSIANRVFELPFRQQHITDVVIDGDSIPGATLVAIPINDPAPYTPTFQSASRQDGRLSLWMDAGWYLIIAKTPISSKYAYSIFDYQVDEVENERDLIEPITMEMGEITPNIPIVATLEVYQGYKSVTSGRIEWYETVGDDTIPIGHSQVGKDGTAIGLLPPPLANF